MIIDGVRMIAGHEQIPIHAIDTAAIIGHDLADFLPVV
jgi:hypothetical protein